MAELTGVDCLFDAHGRIQVRRIMLEQRWLAVEQGRQWHDEQGRHILIMVPGSAVRELLLSHETLQWSISERPTTFPIV